MTATSSTSATCELLAPAGDWECLRAACANGADAVYFGLADFNARHRAHNFTLEELPQVIEYLHRHNVRGYVTMNTLIFSDELPAATEMIAAMASAGVDAVIVQDLGLARLIHEVAPSLPIHGSTQMTLTEPQGIEYVKSLGVERVIVARELSLADVKKIKAATDLPVEVFVHGALCVAYSGQCLTSEALGGRSANRGQCAQACRLPYDLVVDGETRDLGDVAYLLSPQDLASYDFIDELVEAGVCSLKIEGRLKSAHYVAATTKTYRAALDAALAKQTFQLDRQAELDLQQSFSRGFSPGFLKGLNHQKLVGGRFPKARGVRVGTVVGISAAGVLVDIGIEHDLAILKAGDGCVFDEGHPDQDEQGGRLYGVRTVDAAPHGDRPKRLEIFFAEGTLNRAAIAPGAIVWRTDDPTMRRRMEQTFNREPIPRRTAISFHAAGRVGGPLTLTVRDFDGRECSAAWDGPLQLAQKHPLSVEALREQCSRLGKTPFELGPESSNSVTLDAVEPIMVPKSVLNDLRRRAVEQLLQARLAAPRARPIRIEALDELRAKARARNEAETQSVPPSLYVLARTLTQLEAVLAWKPEAPASRPAMVYCDFEDVRRYKDAVPLARAAGVPIGLATLRILKPGEEGLFAVIGRNRPDAVLFRNLAALTHFRQALPGTPLIGDFSLNAANELTAELLLSEGLSRLVPSYDLSWEQLTTLVERSVPHKFETVVHQHMPMFHMEHCVFAHTMSTGTDATNCGRPCDRHRVQLRDRVGAEFPLLADTGCRNTVFNALPQSAAEYLPRMLALGLRHFRVELLLETPEQVGPLLESYARGLAGLDAGRRTWRGLQVLNQLGVTRGTLQTS
jgi:putative protease